MGGGRGEERGERAKRVEDGGVRVEGLGGGLGGGLGARKCNEGVGG